MGFIENNKISVKAEWEDGEERKAVGKHAQTLILLNRIFC